MSSKLFFPKPTRIACGFQHALCGGGLLGPTGTLLPGQEPVIRDEQPAKPVERQSRRHLLTNCPLVPRAGSRPALRKETYGTRHAQTWQSHCEKQNEAKVKISECTRRNWKPGARGNRLLIWICKLQEWRVIYLRFHKQINKLGGKKLTGIWACGRLRDLLKCIPIIFSSNCLYNYRNNLFFLARYCT